MLVLDQNDTDGIFYSEIKIKIQIKFNCAKILTRDPKIANRKPSPSTKEAVRTKSLVNDPHS